MPKTRQWILAALIAPVLFLPLAATAQEDPTAAEPQTQQQEPAPAEPQVLPGSEGEDAGAVARTVGDTAAEVAEKGSALWSEMLMPMLQRLAAGLPGILKALALLLVFWIVAIAVGALVRKGLQVTRVDDRAAKDLGLGGMLETKEGEPRSIAALAGTAVKWVILAFGFLAFFDALELGMVAGPLQNILDKITGVIPSLLQAMVILGVYWVVATILKLAATKGLEAIGFDQKAGKYVARREIKGEEVGPSGLVGRLLFYVVLLFGIPPFLDALGQESLVAPLREMMAKVLEFLPNIIGAVILLFIGKIVATIVREVVSNFLAAVGADSLGARLGIGREDDGRKLSEIGGAVAFFFILIPILVAAVDSLQIKAISEPVKSTLQQLLSAVPLLFGAVVIIAIGYFIARAVRGFVESFLSGVGFDTLPERFGLDFLKPREGGTTLSSIGGTVVMAIILLLTAEQALAMLQLGELSSLVGGLLGYLPNLFVGVVIILAALSLGTYVGNLVASALAGTDHARVVSAVAKYAIVFLGFSMGLTQLGVGREVVQVAVSAVLGGTALALGLAFGLGGRERAKEIIERQSSDA